MNRKEGGSKNNNKDAEAKKSGKNRRVNKIESRRTCLKLSVDISKIANIDFA